MGRGRNKIKSQRGASITFALLLFLVCAMASAVAIVSATAASGRLKNIAETDQRYFAVSSAVDLLKKTLDGKTVVIEEVIDDDPKITMKDGGATTVSTTKTGLTATTLLGEVAIQLHKEVSKISDRYLTLTLGSTTDAKVFIKEQVMDDGGIVLQVKRLLDDSLMEKTAAEITDDDFSGKGFTLTMVFMLEKTVLDNDHKEDVSQNLDGTKTEEETHIKTTEYKWNLTSIKKGAYIA